MANRFLNPAKRLAPEWYSRAAFWKTLRRAAVSAGRKSLETALTLFYCLQDKDTPKWAKGIIVGIDQNRKNCASIRNHNTNISDFGNNIA